MDDVTIEIDALVVDANGSSAQEALAAAVLAAPATQPLDPQVAALVGRAVAESIMTAGLGRTTSPVRPR